MALANTSLPVPVTLTRVNCWVRFDWWNPLFGQRRREADREVPGAARPSRSTAAGWCIRSLLLLQCLGSGQFFRRHEAQSTDFTEYSCRLAVSVRNRPATPPAIRPLAEVCLSRRVGLFFRLQLPGQRSLVGEGPQYAAFDHVCIFAGVADRYSAGSLDRQPSRAMG